MGQRALLKNKIEVQICICNSNFFFESFLRWELKLNTNVFFSNFLGAPGISGQNPGISRQNVCSPWVSRDVLNFWPPSLHVEDPHPTGRYLGPKVVGEKVKGRLLKGSFEKRVRMDLPVPLPVPHPLPLFPKPPPTTPLKPTPNPSPRDKQDLATLCENYPR